MEIYFLPIWFVLRYKVLFEMIELYFLQKIIILLQKNTNILIVNGFKIIT